MQHPAVLIRDAVKVTGVFPQTMSGSTVIVGTAGTGLTTILMLLDVLQPELLPLEVSVAVTV